MTLDYLVSTCFFPTVPMYIYFFCFVLSFEQWIIKLLEEKKKKKKKVWLSSGEYQLSIFIIEISNLILYSKTLHTIVSIYIICYYSSFIEFCPNAVEKKKSFLLLSKNLKLCHSISQPPYGVGTYFSPKWLSP